MHAKRASAPLAPRNGGLPRPLMAGDKERTGPMTEERKGDNGGIGFAREGGGESGGGAYDNPHQGKKEGSGGFMGHGGQSEQAYHGTGQLGEEKVGANANSPAGKSGSDVQDDQRGD